MIKKEEVISFVWQHILLLVSLYVMTFGVAACVRSQLGSSVISTIPYVMASAGKMLDYIPGWTIGGYTIMMNAIFVAQSHRADVRVYLVLESTRDFSRTIRFEANSMHDMGGFHEQALLGKIAKALDVSRGMGKEESRPVESGVGVRTVSFERLVQELAADHQLFVMDRKGTPMREQVFADNPCFLLTDHIPMPKNTFHSLERLGAKKITL